jgi:hypothetical protein
LSRLSNEKKRVVSWSDFVIKLNFVLFYWRIAGLSLISLHEFRPTARGDLGDLGTIVHGFNFALHEIIVFRLLGYKALNVVAFSCGAISALLLNEAHHCLSAV